MITGHGEKMIVQGPITIDNVVDITERGKAYLDRPRQVVDLQQITSVDSSVISMMLEWLRTARLQGCQLQFINLPPNLATLIQLYGIVEMIPASELPH
ncbi:STAS domain-containing protein [Nitrosomonas sp. JL21]|uniref:STAS domain-containing protein n=1 Tax=Nitrosomonas sp. JL21 TaxID=153949 RepID=UPI0013698AED|nr:STAS domain-containing protein [Nitrosomonas sp. JL21]MBL8496532.1 STAS domain-containing protein [Nitrosomonas sp.]MXS76880.1 STAS domain-containing protein [Nitrosomonas sp. JL21]